MWIRVAAWYSWQRGSPTLASCHCMQDRWWHQLGATHFHISALSFMAYFSLSPDSFIGYFATGPSLIEILSHNNSFLNVTVGVWKKHPSEQKNLTLAGLEPAISWFVVRCLIHLATGPSLMETLSHSLASSVVFQPVLQQNIYLKKIIPVGLKCAISGFVVGNMCYAFWYSWQRGLLLPPVVTICKIDHGTNWVPYIFTYLLYHCTIV